MATNICITDPLTTDGQGRLTVCYEPSTTCAPNLAKNGPSGCLEVLPAVAVFRADTDPARGPIASTATTAGPGAQELPIKFATVIENTSAGVGGTPYFTLLASGAVKLTCAGVYSFKARYGSNGVPAPVRQTGGRVRINPGGAIGQILSTEIHDLQATNFNFGAANDGPEFEGSSPGVFLPAGTVIQVQGIIFVNTLGAPVKTAGNIHITYLGARLP